MSRKHRCNVPPLRSALVPAHVYANRAASAATRVAYVVACRIRCCCTRDGTPPASAAASAAPNDVEHVRPRRAHRGVVHREVVLEELFVGDRRELPHALLRRDEGQQLVKGP